MKLLYSILLQRLLTSVEALWFYLCLIAKLRNIGTKSKLSIYVHQHYWLNSLWHRFFWKFGLAWRVSRELADEGLLIIGHVHLLPVLDFLARRSKFRRWAWIYGLEVWGSEASRWVSRLNKLDRIVSISSFTADQVIRAKNDTPIEIVPPFVDKTKFTPTTTPERIRRNEILICGRMSPGQLKGHDLLLECLSRAMEQTGENLMIRMVGTGNDFERIHNKARDLGLAENVILTGR